VNAATMLGQSKTASHQAEIDSACELIDFWRFNAHYAEQIMPNSPSARPGQWNRVEQRPLDGFVFAVTPFNFTRIAGNLPTAPALMGNTVVWKPASRRRCSRRTDHEAAFLREAGLPPGVINLVPGERPRSANRRLAHPDLAGVHFTGSTGVFHHMWRTIGANIATYGSYPRIVGETGGKDFIFAHPSADVDALAVAIVRGGFEYQGQKCSAASRAYVPESIWPHVKDGCWPRSLPSSMGDVSDFATSWARSSTRRAFKRSGYIDSWRRKRQGAHPGRRRFDDDDGLLHRAHRDRGAPTPPPADGEEIFGPVLTLFVYDDDKEDDAHDLATARPVRADRRDLRAGPLRDHPDEGCAGRRRELLHRPGAWGSSRSGQRARARQLLHQRQADRRRGGPAALGGGGDGPRPRGTNDKAGSWILSPARLPVPPLRHRRGGPGRAQGRPPATAAPASEGKQRDPAPGRVFFLSRGRNRGRGGQGESR
jgi:hypothetical protein